MTNVKKNFIYYLFYRVLILIVPLIIAPYLSRVIGAKGVGIYSYTYSIVYYFMLLTALGVNTYGNRSIAKVRDDKVKLSKTFWSIYYFQFIMGIIMSIIYFCYLLLFNKQYLIYSIIDFLFLLSAMLDINWFFFGIEEFKKPVIRNTFVKIGNIFLIFLLVRTDADIWKYTLIMGSTTFISQIMMWPFIKDKVFRIKITFLDIKKHIKPNIILFIPEIAISLYKVMDKIMLGSINNIIEVGYYENAEKIIGIPLALIASLGVVMLPRMSNIIAKKNIGIVNDYLMKSFKFLMFMAFAMSCGLIAIGYNFAPLYFGSGFQKTGILIILLAISIPFSAFKHLITTQYLIPKEKDVIYIKAVGLGALINLIINFLLIPRYESVGACIGTIVAEFTVMFYQNIAIRKELPIKEYIIKSFPYLIKAILMLILIYPFNFIYMNNMLRIAIQVVLGCLVYALLNIKYISSIINFKEIINKYILKNHKT